MSGLAGYERYDGLGLAELVRKKEVKPIELVEEAIGRIERLNPRLNAVIHKMYKPARRAAEAGLPEGPFIGVPFLLKDLAMACAGEPLRNGSRFFKDFKPDHDSELVRRFRAAGVVFLGKTNTPELGLMPVTEPALFGPCHNPWELGRTSGGSSGGSAAAVAARMVPLAHASDGAGSIRIPSSCCGVFGLKPTRGRNPLGPDFGELWRGFHIDHVISRSVRDSAAMLDVTAGPDAGAPYYASPPHRTFLSETAADPGRLRIAFTTANFLGIPAHDDCRKGLEETVRLCADLGHEMEETAPVIDGDGLAKALVTLVCVETEATMADLETYMGRRAGHGDLEPFTQIARLLGRRYRAADYSRALNFIQRTARQVGAFFEKYPVLLTPALTRPPLRTYELQPKGGRALAMKLVARLKAGAILGMFINQDALAAEFFSFIAYLPLFNATGQPAMSVPLCWNEAGLPIGMQFVGRYGDEATLFRLAGQLEKARPWADRVPPACAE